MSLLKRWMHGSNYHPLERIKALLSSPMFWIILVALNVATQLIFSSRLGEGPRNVGLDAVTVFSRPPESLKSIIIVEIDDEAFRSLFSSQLPLNRATLAGLLESIREAGAAVIGVDLALVRPIKIEDGAAAGDGDERPPLVWAIGKEQIQVDGRVAQSYRGSLAGVPTFIRGRDGTIRRYQASSDDWPGSATFVSLIVSQYCARMRPTYRGCTAEARGTAQPLIAYLADREMIDRVPASHVLKLRNERGWIDHGVLRGRVVLVGGTFREARDTYSTPLDEQPGIYIAAQAIATELDGRPLKDLRERTLFIAKLITGIIVAIVGTLLPSRVTVTLHLVIVPLCAIAAAAIAGSIDYWFDFVPVLMAGFVDQWHHDLTSGIDLRHNSMS